MIALAACRALVLDDHPLQCLALRDQLLRAGLGRVDTADSATAALERLRDTEYDLVLTDIRMPGMDGAQFIRELARMVRQPMLRQPTPRRPMLAVVTGCARPLASSIGLMAGEIGLPLLGTFIKPVTDEQIAGLAARLRSHLSGPAAGRSEGDGHGPPGRADVAAALRDGDIQAWFQPKQSLACGAIVGAEALARWRHRDQGLLLPGAFLPAVRRHGLEHELLIRMLDDSLAAASAWRHAGLRIPVSINLPVRLLDRPRLPEELLQRVGARGLAAEDVTFELLEDDMTVAPGNYHMGASRLRLQGFGLAQDDFGKGYSSLYSLISTPFTELKIDRAFVHGAAEDPARAAVLRAAAQLGRQLGLRVTAEGVETEDDLRLLRRLGCDCAQGFLISPAVDPAAFLALPGHAVPPIHPIPSVNPRDPRAPVRARRMARRRAGGSGQ